MYEYKMVQIPPTIVIKKKEVRGGEAALYLQELANRENKEGWEFYRVDTIGVISRPGCLASMFGSKATTFDYYVVTFRKIVS